MRRPLAFKFEDDDIPECVELMQNPATLNVVYLTEYTANPYLYPGHDEYVKVRLTDWHDMGRAIQRYALARMIINMHFFPTFKPGNHGISTITKVTTEAGIVIF